MIVFIDGENFRQRLAETLVLSNILPDKHARFTVDIVGLLRKIFPDDDLAIKYYASEIRLPQDHELSKEVLEYINSIKEYRRYWTREIKEQGIEYIRAGNLKIRGEVCKNCGVNVERLQEKGVDVRLALDIFEATVEDEPREIAVFSSDVDICPAFHKVKNLGTKVTYVCFEKFLNRGSSAAADKTIKISTEILAEFVKTY